MQTKQGMVKPAWSAEARIPGTIRLPVPVANATIGTGNREVWIKTPDQELPALIVKWMQGDVRYRTWFLQTEPKTGEATDEPREQQGETLHVERDGEPVNAELDEDKPKRQRRKKTADDGEE